MLLMSVIAMLITLMMEIMDAQYFPLIYLYIRLVTPPVKHATGFNKPIAYLAQHQFICKEILAVLPVQLDFMATLLSFAKYFYFCLII